MEVICVVFYKVIYNKNMQEKSDICKNNAK